MLFGHNETKRLGRVTVSRVLGQLTLAACVLLLFPHKVGLAQASEGEGRAPGIAQVTTNYSDVVSLTRAQGAATALQVELKEWQLAAHGAAIEMPDQGFYVAHLVSRSSERPAGQHFDGPRQGRFLGRGERHANGRHHQHATRTRPHPNPLGRPRPLSVPSASSFGDPSRKLREAGISEKLRSLIL